MAFGNKFNMILDNKDRFKRPEHSSPDNEPQKSPGFVQKQSPEVLCKRRCS